MNEPTTFADLKEQEKEAKRKVLLQAAIHVFSEKSLQKASLREIADAAGISHASIYRYFADKQALFVEAFLLGAKELEEKLEKLINTPPAHDLLQRTAATIIDYLNEHDHYFMMMTQFMLEGGLSAKSVRRLNQAMKSFLDKIETIVRLSGGHSNARYLAHTFFACLNGILITFHNYPGRSSKELHKHMKTLSLVFIQMFLDGLETGNYNQHLYFRSS